MRKSIIISLLLSNTSAMNLQGLNKLKATLNQPPTYNVGADGCTPESPCDLGVGDCDTAEDCKGDL